MSLDLSLNPKASSAALMFKDPMKIDLTLIGSSDLGFGGDDDGFEFLGELSKGILIF